jgi:hypothetical protein
MSPTLLRETGFGVPARIPRCGSAVEIKPIP